MIAAMGSPSERYEQIRKLTEISRALTYTLNVEDLLRLAADRAAELLGSDRALLMLADEDGLLRVRASLGVHEAELEQFREPLDETLTRRLLGLLGAVVPECFLGVPMVVDGRVTGLLAVVRPEGQPCTEEDEWLLSAVADQVAVALENARLQEEVRREREKHTRALAGAGEAEEASERALATLSHDVRSPLNAIDSYAELIELEIFGPVSDRQREALGRIRLSGRHLLAVLENVLEMTRLSAGAVRVRTAPIRPASVIGEAMLMVQPSAAARDQKLVVTNAADMTVDADANRLRQVLVNLLGNAVKYTPRSGTIRVAAARMRKDGRTWGTISVEDDGPGIPPEKQQAIFQPYYRLPAASADAPEGLGLGLAISRELVRQMGGDIDVASGARGGCVFTIRLPAASGDPRPPRGPAER
ncbi:MAG TPA: ATP-binding protein [Longimicrobiales bacterium]|nr:ATP-binding protein [Longimicrobiales bacterium]